MTRYLISFDDGAMTFPEEELPDVAAAAHAVAKEAQDFRPLGVRRSAAFLRRGERGGHRWDGHRRRRESLRRYGRSGSRTRSHEMTGMDAVEKQVEAVGRSVTMNAPTSITITPVFVADLSVEGERMPVYVHVIDHPDARVLVDTGMTELHPAMADMDPRLQPLSEQDFDLAGIDIVVNTHLHADHCGGNHLFAGKPTTSSVGSSTTRAARTTTPFASGSRRPACGTCRSTASSSCFRGSGSSRRRATHPACRWSSSRLAGARSSSAADVAVWFGESTSRPPKADGGSLRSTPSSSGSRAGANHGDPAPFDHVRLRGLGAEAAPVLGVTPERVSGVSRFARPGR